LAKLVGLRQLLQVGITADTELRTPRVNQLLVAPSLVGQLLLGAELTGVALTMARLAGIALIGLGVACWLGPPRSGMLTYGAVVTLYLAYVGLAGGLAGILLWPAVVVHVVLMLLLIRASAGGKETKCGGQSAL